MCFVLTHIEHPKLKKHFSKNVRKPTPTEHDLNVLTVVFVLDLCEGR